MPVKHLFFVQSNVTIYLVRHYIELKNIDEANIIIFYTRVSLADIDILPGKKIDFLNVFYRKFVNVNKTHLQMFYLTWTSIYKVNSFIRKEVKSDFELIVPHLIWDIKQIFASSPKCKKIIYLEEGDMSYATENETQKKIATMETYTGERLRKYFSLGKLFHKHPFQNRNKQHEAICLSDKAFPFPYIKKHVYDFKEVFQNDTYLFKEDYNNSVILLLEHITWLNEQQTDAYYFKLQEVLGLIKKQFAHRIFLKPHPELFKDVKRQNLIMELVEKCGLEATVIHDPIELIITRFKDVKIFAHRSSLIRYCCYAGVKPFVWGMSLISEEERAGNTLAFKFLEQHPDQIQFVD